MSPFEQAARRYDGADIIGIVAFCARNGIVHCDKDVFFCAYPTVSGDDARKLEKSVDISDTWYVYIASGSIKKAFLYIEPKKFIAFSRFDNKVRLIGFERLRRLLWAMRAK